MNTSLRFVLEIGIRLDKVVSTVHQELVECRGNEEANLLYFCTLSRWITDIKTKVPDMYGVGVFSGPKTQK